ncbi:hypothetical protein BOX15_Mlig019518g1 [Macrostomum lignano]|uniref:non-specific serine/threonine protein kinase n=1 Tax=Macrostomum lignano TaxID=282301 RepID=A0A267GMX4_9PLAT|nr:hypothetical protein BOX15_Mlig019518g1 [Macrostomum lignano]
MPPPRRPQAPGSAGSLQSQQPQRVFEIPACARHHLSPQRRREADRTELETANAAYRIVARIGEGSFGTTYLARIECAKRLSRLQAHEDMPLSPTSLKDQRQLLALMQGSSVVVKEIKTATGDAREAEAAALNSKTLEIHGRTLESMDIVKSIAHIQHCDHPFIARLLDSQYALTTHDTPFEVYEYYAIGDAMRLLRYISVDSEETNSKHREATFLQASSLYLALQVAEALAYLHESGFIHFDLKMDNVFVDEFGDAKLGDFGLAKPCRLGRKMENPYYYWGSRCDPSTFMSVRWVPPEQLDESGGSVDHSADWFGLGALLFNMLYGRLPFDEHKRQALAAAPAGGEDPQLTKRRYLRLWRAAPRPKVEERPKLNQRTKNLLYNLLAFEPAARLGSGGCGEVFARLHALCADLGLRWFDALGSGGGGGPDIDRMRRMLRRGEVPRPYRIKLQQKRA